MEIKATLKQPYTENERISFIVEQNHKLGYEIRQVETTYEVEIQVPSVIKEIITETIQVPVLDENDNPILDENGNPIFEEKIVEREVERTETEIVTEEIQVPIYDEDGNPVLDEDGNRIFETKTVEKEVTKHKTEVVEKTGYNLEAWGYTEEEKQEQERQRVGNLKCSKRNFALVLQQFGISYNTLKEIIATNEQAQLEWDLCIELQRSNPLLDSMAVQLDISSDMLDSVFKYVNGEIENVVENNYNA